MNNIEIAPPCNNSLIELLALADCWIPKPGSACAIDIGGPIPHGKAWEHYFEFIRLKEALQNPLLPSRMKQKCSVRFFRTASKNAVFLSWK